MKILIVKLSAIGDVIHTLPALNAIRKHHPQADITWLVEEAASDLVIGHPALDRVLVSRRKSWLKNLKGPRRRKTLKEMVRFVKQLKETRYDLILDFQALLKSGILIALARGSRKVGFDRGLEHMEHSYIFLNEKIAPVDMEIHALKRGLLLLEAIGVPCKKTMYNLPVTPWEDRSAGELLRRHGLEKADPLIAVNPVAKWETKLWPGRRFARLADRLAETFQAGIVFTGSRDDRPIIDPIIAAMQSGAANLAGETSLKILAALYRKCRLLVTTDTGPMHLAAAVGTPVAALFGPTAPWRTGPYGAKHRIVRTGVRCSPCFKRTCSIETLDCMMQMSVQDVFDAAALLLSQANGCA